MRKFMRSLKREERRRLRKEQSRLQREALELKRLQGKFDLWCRLNPKEPFPGRCGIACPHYRRIVVSGHDCPRPFLKLDLRNGKISFCNEGMHYDCVEWIRNA